MQGIGYYAYTREMGAASEWQLMADLRLMLLRQQTLHPTCAIEVNDGP